MKKQQYGMYTIPPKIMKKLDKPSQRLNHPIGKLLYLDIEKAPHKGYFYGLHGQDYIPYQNVEEPGFLLSWAANWHHDNRVMWDSNARHKKAKCDKAITHSIHALMRQADAVVAHNANFDIKELNVVFKKHGLLPLNPRVLCTLRKARRYFRFPSNRLGDLVQFLNIGEKKEGLSMPEIRQLFEGKKIAWAKLVEYNIHDVICLRQLHESLLAWGSAEFNVAAVAGKPENCPKCGSDKVKRDGRDTVYSLTASRIYQRFRCGHCGTVLRSRVSEKQAMEFST